MPDLYDRSIGWRRFQPDRGDVTEIVDSDEIRQPPWRPRFSSRNGLLVAPLPVIRDAASGFPDRRHRIALDVGASDQPAQPSANQEHKEDQRPQAEPHVIPPRA